MSKQKFFKPGDRVTYTPQYGMTSIGIVKDDPGGHIVFVVYNCSGRWDEYERYTASATNRGQLTEGWPEPEGFKFNDKKASKK